jgi:hypothetical protein
MTYSTAKLKSAGEKTHQGSGHGKSIRLGNVHENLHGSYSGFGGYDTAKNIMLKDFYGMLTSGNRRRYKRSFEDGNRQHRTC